MRSLLLFATLFFATPSLHALAISARAECAAKLNAQGEDPGQAYAAEVFAELEKNTLAEVMGHSGIGRFRRAFPPGPGRGDDALVLTEKTLAEAETPEAPGTLLKIWGRFHRAARRANLKSAETRRLIVVGEEAIRAHQRTNWAEARNVQRAFERAKVQPGGPGVDRLSILANLTVLAWSAFKLSIIAPAAVAFAHHQHYLLGAGTVLGLVTFTGPVIKFSISTLFVHAKQALINRGWIRAKKDPASTWEDEQEFNARIDRLFADNDPEAFAYRGARARIDLRRTDARFPFQLGKLPTGAAVAKRMIQTKGQVGAIDRRVIEFDEVVRFDRKLKQWVLVAVYHVGR